jgi:hypothetical protein
MARTLLVVPTTAGAGLARTCLGLVRALDRRGVDVAFVKPVAQPRPDGSADRSTALVAAISALRPPDPLSTAELWAAIRGQYRATRAARAARKSLARDLASYTSPHDLNDLEAILERYSDDETADIRRILAARRADLAQGRISA